MRIRNLLIALVVISAALIVARLTMLQMRAAQSARLDSFQLAVERASRDAASLLVLSQDFLLHETPRAARQWRTVQAELGRTLPRLVDEIPALHDDVVTMTEVNRGLTPLFAAIEAAASDDGIESKERLDMLAEHLVSETRRINDGAFELAEKLTEIRRVRDATEQRVAQTGQAIFGLLTLVLAYVVFRRVLQPMTDLEKTAEAVRGGDLAARSGLGSDDEFGRMSRVFDAMIATLQDREATLAASNEHLMASERSLAAARRDLENIIDAVPSLIGYWDSSLHNRFANRAYRTWFGCEASAIQGKHIGALLGPELLAMNKPYMEAALRGEPQTFERSIPVPGGTDLRHSLAHYIPDVADGEVRGFYVLVHDVTELTTNRLRLTALQRENEALLQTMRGQTIFSVADRAGRIIEVNDNFCAIAGYGRDELIGRNHRVINSGLHPHEFWAAMWRQVSRGNAWRGEVCNRAKDGSLYWVDNIIAPFLGEDGRVEKYISIRTDVTARKIAEDKLRASEEFLDRVGRVAGVGGWEVDLESGAVTWSDQTYRIHEVDPDYRPQPDDGSRFYTAQGRRIVETAMARAAADGTGWDLEMPLVTAKGRTIWVRTVATVESRDGRAVRLVGAFQDITLQRAADERLQSAYDRFSIAADSANIGVWEYDVATGALVWDERMYRLYRQEPTAWSEPYALWRDNVHAEDRDRVEGHLQAALRGECDFDPEFRIVWPDGEIRYLKASSRVLRNGDGEAVGMAGVNIDISDRKRAELKLSETSSLLQTVLESASQVSIIATDPERRVTVFNAGAANLLGYAPAEVIGRGASLLGVDDLADRAEPTVGTPGVAGSRTDAATNRPPYEATYRRKDGSEVPVSVATTLMTGAGGKAVGYLSIAHDVTSQKRYEASLLEAMNKAEQASVAKSEFLANMSHEIRTPMNAVIGLAYLLRKTRLDPEQVGFLSRIELASNALMTVINNVLDLSKIEAGELLVEDVPFGLDALVADLMSVMSIQSDAKGITLATEPIPELPQRALRGDSTRLNQILTNLLSNAIKFTDRGGVTLRIRQTHATADRIGLRFEVDDTGIGFDAEAGEQIFNPFVQADTSTTRRFGGTGLGLSIVRKLVQLMGGKVGYDSTPGRGSCFWVTLDFRTERITEPDRDARTPPAASARLKSLRILIVDDSELNCMLATHILELEGARVKATSDGEMACNLLRSDPTAFDVVLMDVQMPVMDGYAATRCIRNDIGLIDLPVIALTAGALVSERTRALAAGMNDFITKPFGPDSLVLCVQRHAKAARVQERLPAPADREEPNRPWPDIDGIDIASVRARLSNDLDLFRSILGRLFNEFGGLTPPPEDADATTVARCAASMHKLRGSAGLIGDRELVLRASAAEAAFRNDDLAVGRWNVGLIVSRLGALRDASRAAMATLPVAAVSAVERPAGPLAPHAVEDLIALLSENSMAAAASFDRLSGGLRQKIGAQTFNEVAALIDNLEYAAAARALSVGEAGAGL